MQFVVSCVMVCLYKSPFLPKTLGLQTPKQTGQIILQYIVKANHLSFFGSFCKDFSSARGGGRVQISYFPTVLGYNAAPTWHLWAKHWYKLYQKALRETQTLRAGCSKAEPKNFAPLQTPFPGARVGQNLISQRWLLPSSTDQVCWGSMHTISSYRGNRPTNTHIRPPTDRTDYNILCRSWRAV